MVNCQELPKVIQQIEQQGYLYYKQTKNGPSILESDDFINLKKCASEAQLIDLTKHKNGQVKSLAFLVLASKKYNNLYDIILNQIKDTTTVTTQSGCIKRSSYTTDYFIDIVTEEYFVDLDFPKLSTEQKNTIEALLIADNNSKLSTRTSVIFALEPTSENYNLILSLVKQEKNYAAIYNLATYKKETDKKLIASFFNDEKAKYEAVRCTFIFHDDYFYPYLKKACKKIIRDYLVDEYGYSLFFKALAKYPKQETLKFFEKTLAERDYNEYRNEKISKYILIAISKYPDPVYNSLKESIKLSPETLEEVNKELLEKD